MFQSTLRKLALLNSLVFLLIFIIFGTILYGYMTFRLFDNVDDAMQSKARSFRIANGRISQVRIRSLFDPRTFLLLRDTAGNIVNLYPFRTEESSNITELAAHIRIGELRTREFENHFYRVISLPYQHEENILYLENRAIIIKEVIAISIVDSEIGLLKNLLWIILGGLILGMIVIILAGYYLAKRAMIPIQAAWDRQQQFVADASHELRSPLTVIRSNAELMLRHPEHIIEQESPRITNIVREAMRMTKLIASLLTLARSDANQAELHLTVIRLDEVVKTVISQFKPLAELTGISLTATMDEDLELVADRERLHQLLVILLDNALKYTQEGRISVSCYKTDGSVVINVEDTGCGISPEHLPRVFDRFFRSDKARSRESGGTGLGLAIAKWIVEKHSGKISVESQLGQGSKFKVVFPAKTGKK